MLIGCWQHLDHSLTKAAQAIQDHAPHLAATFATHLQLCQALQTMARGRRRAVSLIPIRKRRAVDHKPIYKTAK